MVVIFKGNLNHAVDKPQAIMQVLHFNKNTLLPGYFTTIYIFLVWSHEVNYYDIQTGYSKFIPAALAKNKWLPDFLCAILTPVQVPWFYFLLQ